MHAQKLGAARDLDSWRRPEGSRPLGTRIPLAQKQTYLPPSISVYFSSSCVQLARQALDRTILCLEVVLLNMDIVVALVFPGRDSVSIYISHLLCQ